MVERINGKTILTTPVSAEDLEGIKIGDIIYLNGSMTTCRDVAHRRLGLRRRVGQSGRAGLPQIHRLLVFAVRVGHFCAAQC